MMDERDEWKKKAVELSIGNINEEASEEETEAWGKQRELRNKVNNAKKNDATLIPKQMIVL